MMHGYLVVQTTDTRLLLQFTLRLQLQEAYNGKLNLHVEFHRPHYRTTGSLVNPFMPAIAWRFLARCSPSPAILTVRASACRSR